MSQTVLATMLAVRKLTDDLNASDYETSSERMLAYLTRRAIQVRNMLGLGVQKQSSLITLVANTREYAVTLTTASYTSIDSITYSRDGRPVPIKTRDEIEALYVGTTTPTGEPVACHVYERETDNSFRLIVYPEPNATAIGQTLAMWTEQGSPELATGDTLAWPLGALRALESAVAADCLAAMTDEALAKRRTIRPEFQRLENDFDQMLREERARINNMKRQRRVTLVVR